MNRIKQYVCHLAFAAVFIGHQAALAQWSDYCVLLDRMEEPIWHYYGGWVTASRVEGAGKTSQLEWGASAGLWYHRTAFGEFDFRAAIESMTFTSSAGLNVPTTVAAAHLDLRYVTGFDNGYALQLGMEPGLYSEIRHAGSQHLFFPFSIAGIRAVNPSLSLLGGLNFYPGFDRLVDPRLGARWVVSDFLLIDLFYPASQVVVRPTMNWTVRAGVEIRDYLEYQLKRSDERDRLMIDETRLYVGMDWRQWNERHFFIEAGRLVDRSLSFRRNESRRDLGDAYYLRLGFAHYL